jgi:alpha-D-xyloside xylohydrolase
VAPVTEPAATTRHTYLPKTKWFDFWTGRTFEGGTAIEIDAPLRSLPLFVRAGSIVPLGPDEEFAAEKDDPIELRVYPGLDSDFALYEDEGDSYNYEKGAYATIGLHWDESHKTLTISDRHGEFPHMSKSRTFHIVFVRANHGVGGGLATADKVVEYSGKKVTVTP